MVKVTIRLNRLGRVPAALPYMNRVIELDTRPMVHEFIMLPDEEFFFSVEQVKQTIGGGFEAFVRAEIEGKFDKWVLDQSLPTT